MGTGITIIPYIDSEYTTISKNKQNIEIASDNSSGKQSSKDFETALNNAKKAAAAVAIDKLVSASKNGSVDVTQVQQFFDKHGIDIKITNSGASNRTNSTSSSAPGQNNSASTNSTGSTGSTGSTDTSNSSGSATDKATTRTHIANEGTLKCPAEYHQYFEEAAEKYNIDVKFLKSVAKAESNFNPNDVSSSGAMGIMQLMPATAKEYNVSNPYDPKENIMGGAELLSVLLKKYKGDKTLALAAYNAGPGNVSKYGGVPPFQETQTYIKRVLGFYNE